MTLKERWRRTSLPNKLLIIIGAAAALFAGGQLWILKESGDVSSKQTERLIRAETEIASSMRTAIQDNRQAIETSARENRAAIAANAEANMTAIAASNKQNAAIVHSSNEQSKEAIAQTQRLREDAAEQRIENIRPVLVFEVIGQYKLSLRNVGKGPALNIELRLSQVRADGKLTYLSNFIARDQDRQFLTLKEGDSEPLPGTETVRKYALAAGWEMQWGMRDGFVAIATYTDINRRPYYSVSIIHTIQDGVERSLIMKSTTTAPYDSGNIEQLNVLDFSK